MATYLDTSAVQEWLEETKLTVDVIEVGLDSLSKSKVFGVLSARYDVSQWTTIAASPSLVVQLVAMSYAAGFYRRQYSEDLDSNPAWPVWLEQTVQNTLNQIIDGSLDLLDTTTETTSPSQPVFYPNDASSVDDPAAFSMGQVF